MVNINKFRDLNSIKDLLPNEKEYYEDFLKNIYLDNLKASEYLLIKFPRWSIISAYYAMHDISKLFLAKKYNLKLSPPSIHAATIAALKEFVSKKEVLDLIKKAEDFEEIKSIHGTLIRGKDEREKSQYYTSQSISPKSPMQKSSYFFEKIVKPYIKILEKLIEK